MIVAAPVEVFKGFDSELYGHFGSAPAFALVDTEAGSVVCLENADQNHTPGTCHAMRSLAGQHVDAVLVGGIGQGALLGLQAAGIRVWSTSTGTLRDALVQWQDHLLHETTLESACEGHGEGHQCAHG